MRLTALTGAALLSATLALGACSSQTPTAQTATSPAPTAMHAMAMQPASRTGMFDGLNDKHVAGTVRLTGPQLQLSGFSSDSGPDLHFYLTNGSDENAVSAGKELGTVAFDQATQRFSLSGIDASHYHTVVINCDKAKVVFGSARLT